MKKMMIATSLLLLVFANASAQRKVARVQVKSDAVTALPSGKPYVIDLTRGWKVYSVPASVDRNRVRIRTRTGEVALGNIVKKMGISGVVTVGTLSDMRTLNFTRASGGGGLSYDCTTNVEFCTCDGFNDCLKLILSDKCGANAHFCVKGETTKLFCVCDQ